MSVKTDGMGDHFGKMEGPQCSPDLFMRTGATCYDTRAFVQKQQTNTKNEKLLQTPQEIRIQVLDTQELVLVLI